MDSLDQQTDGGMNEQDTTQGIGLRNVLVRDEMGSFGWIGFTFSCLPRHDTEPLYKQEQTISRIPICYP